MGLVLGDSTLTRWSLRAAAAGRPVGLGAPRATSHVIHSDDVGGAVAGARSTAPSGVYNVGAEPVRRADLVARVRRAQSAGTAASFVGPLMSRLGGPRLEPLARSLRVSSDRFGGTHRLGAAPGRVRRRAGSTPRRHSEVAGR